MTQKTPTPPKAPTESSAEFLAKWDWWIQVAGFGELALSIITLIFVRGRTAWLNARSAPRREVFPSELDAGEVEKRLPVKREKFSPKKEIAKKHASFDFEGLRRLREALRDISFRLAGYSFKSYVRGDAVWVLMMRANQGTQETVTSAKARLSILEDAMRMEREAFRGRLEKFLRENGFEI